MNKEFLQEKIDYPINYDSYRMLFKGIWTGVLLSLIVHQFLIH